MAPFTSPRSGMPSPHIASSRPAQLFAAWILLQGRRRREQRGSRPGRSDVEQVGEDRMRIEVALMRGLQHAGEDFVRARAAGAAIPATDFAQDDRRSNRLFGSPRGGLGAGAHEKGEERGQLGVEVLCQTAEGRVPPRRGEEAESPREELAGGDGEPARRDHAGGMAVAQGERRLQEVGDGRRPPGRCRRQDVQ